MRLLPVCTLAAVAGLLATGTRAIGQPAEEFGVLKTSRTPPALPRELPAGVEPSGPVSSGTAPAAPVNPFPLNADAGAWLVCAATYSGPDGAELARQLALELRNRHRMTAFIYNRGDEERRQQQKEWEELKKRYPPGTPLRRRMYRVQDQYAVLVAGQFKDFEAASSYLPQVKKLPPPTLKLEGGKNPYEVMTYQDIDPDSKKPVTRTALVNPFHNAMVVRNPLVPTAQSARPKWDPFWKQLNAHEEYSLLKNPKRYTLVVKEYMGARTLQPQKASGGGFLSALGLGGSRPGEALDAAAQQAHELARFLSHQGLGFKTWVLHTRHSSVVCVGGFDGLDDPEMQRASQVLSNLRFTPKGGGIDPIGLLPSPVPVEVPRP